MQSVALDAQNDLALDAFYRAHYGQRLAVEQTYAAAFEAVVARGVAVVDSDQLARTLDRYAQSIHRRGHEAAVGIDRIDRNERKVVTVGRDPFAIGRERQPDGLACRAPRLSHDLLAVLVCHCRDLARLESDALPQRMQPLGGLGAAAERAAVDQQLDLVGRIIVCPQIDLVALRPVPVREQMQRRLVGPLRAVHVVAVLGEPAQVDDTEV